MKFLALLHSYQSLTSQLTQHFIGHHIQQSPVHCTIRLQRQRLTLTNKDSKVVGLFFQVNYPPLPNQQYTAHYLQYNIQYIVQYSSHYSV